MTKYEFRREVRRLCAEANKTIGLWRMAANKATDWFLALFVITCGLAPVILWAFMIIALVHFILKWW